MSDSSSSIREHETMEEDQQEEESTEQQRISGNQLSDMICAQYSGQVCVFCDKLVCDTNSVLFSSGKGRLVHKECYDNEAVNKVFIKVEHYLEDLIGFKNNKTQRFRARALGYMQDCVDKLYGIQSLLQLVNWPNYSGGIDKMAELYKVVFICASSEKIYRYTDLLCQALVNAGINMYTDTFTKVLDTGFLEHAKIDVLLGVILLCNNSEKILADIRKEMISDFHYLSYVYAR
jgi:hypothetical protein